MRSVLLLLPLVLIACTATNTRHRISSQPTAIFSPGTHRIATLKEIVPLLDTLDVRDLVVWDVDGVILTPKNILYRPKANKIRLILFQEFEKKYGTEEARTIFSKINIESSWELVDRLAPRIIKKLQHQHVKTVALTAIGADNTPNQENPLQWRIDMLRSFDINFTWPRPMEKILWSDNAGYQDGVIASKRTAKGVILSRFLNKAQFKPRTIVFIDDGMENIRDVEQSCKVAGIRYYGFHFEAETFMDDLTPNLCQLRFQIESSAKGLPWPTDKEAQSAIKNKRFKCESNKSRH